MLGPLIAEYIAVVEERIDRRFATLLEKLKNESEQTHNTVLENQKLILNYLTNPSSSSYPLSNLNLNLNLNSSPPGGFNELFYPQDNGALVTPPPEINYSQTSRQRAIASNNMAKAAQKKKKEEEAPAKKRKTNNSVTSSWDFPIIEESAYPLSTSYELGGTNIPDDNNGVMVITESNKESIDGQWQYEKSLVPKAPSSGGKKKIPIPPKERHCDACGGMIPDKYWAFFKVLMPVCIHRFVFVIQQF